MIWFLENIDRFTQEREAVDSLEKEVDWLQEVVWQLVDSDMCLDVDIQAHNHSYPLRMKYPAVYPACPPTVIPRGDSSQHWSIHQYGFGGELCLELGPDNWEPRFYGVDMLRSAFKLLHSENPKGKEEAIVVPSRHATTIGQDVRSAFCRFVVHDELIKALEKVPVGKSAQVELRDIMHRIPSITFIALICSVDIGKGTVWKNPYIPAGIIKDGRSVSCIYCKTQLQPSALHKISKTALIELLSKEVTDLPNAMKKKPSTAFFLVSDKEKNLHLFWSLDDKEKVCIKYSIVKSSIKKINERLGDLFDKLRDKQVGIVGLGSVGSKIAISLARSGVSSFFLIDDDILLPENICRHALSWKSIGMHKVDAVAEDLHTINPDCQIDVRRIKLSGQEATANVGTALRRLGDCDLIFDATADPTTFNQLSAVAQQFKKPLIWMEVYAGGIGGFVARYRPGIEPYPHLMRRALHQSLEGEEEIPGSGDVDYSMVDEEKNIIIAQDADVGVIANHAIRMGLDVLADSESPKFPYAMYLIGLEKAWRFDQPYRAIPISVSDVQVDEEQIVSSAKDINESLELIRQMIELGKSEDNTAE